MKQVKIITDSCSDLPRELREAFEAGKRMAEKIKKG